MTERLLELIGDKYPLCELNVGDFSALSVSGMRFSIRAYHAEGLGHVSVMRAKGFFGLMKMDTLIVVPKEKELPLYSYDRIYAMGNDTLIVELYDTLTAWVDLSSLEEAKKRYASLPERDAGEHWYDSIKLPESISKKCKKARATDCDALALLHLDAFLNASSEKTSDEAKKKELSLRYVTGLLEHGGPSTDVFKKAFGEEKTARLFREALFGV